MSKILKISCIVKKYLESLISSLDTPADIWLFSFQFIEFVSCVVIFICGVLDLFFALSNL